MVRPLEMLDPLLHDLRRQQRHRHLHGTAEANRWREVVSSSVDKRRERRIRRDPYTNRAAAGRRMYLARRATESASGSGGGAGESAKGSGWWAPREEINKP